MAAINWTAEAQTWLKDIHEYIALDNRDAADRTILGIFRKTQMLREYPEIGYKYESSERRIRILQYGHYRIAYLIRADNNIDILGVFHGALNIERYLL